MIIFQYCITQFNQFNLKTKFSSIYLFTEFLDFQYLLAKVPGVARGILKTLEFFSEWHTKATNGFP